jgi:hypothetical protein
VLPTASAITGAVSDPNRLAEYTSQLAQGEKGSNNKFWSDHVGNREQRRWFDFRERANDAHKMRVIALPSAAQSCCRSSNAEKRPERNSGLMTLNLNRGSLRELAECLSGTGLEGFSRRKRGFLSEHYECLGLLGQRFELLA